MRVVFAGTPEVALPALAAVADVRPRAGRGRHPPRRSDRAWPPAGALAGGRGGRRARRTGAEARAPARAGLPGRAARARPGRLPGRRLRRPAAAVGARHPAPRLGQPALLPAAGLAGRGAGAARDLGRRRRHRAPPRSGSSRSSTPDPTYGLMTETIRPDDTAGDLLGRLAEGGAGLLVATLDGLADGSLEERPQSGDDISFAPKITVDDARVDWSQPAAVIDRQVRACTPAPGAWTTYAGERLKLGPLTLADGSLPPGELMAGKSAVVVGTGAGALRLGDVQAVGKRPMPAADWARGLRLDRRRGARVSRRARVSDIDAICRSLPEVELGTSWGDRPTYLVRQKPKPRGFVLARAPRHDAVDPETGEEYDDLLVIRTAERRGQGGAGRGRRAVLHHRPLPRLQRRPGPAEPPRGGRRRGAARGPDRRLAGRGAEVARQEVPGRLSRDALRPDPARRAAFEVLKAVRAKDAYTNLVLPHQLGKYRLDGRDAAFATELAAGTIRRQGTYDAILAACTDRPLANTAAKVLDVLRLGLPPAARDARRAPRGDQHQRRPGPRRGRPRPVRVRQRGAAQGVCARPRHLAHADRRRPRDPLLPPAVDRRRAGRGTDRVPGEAAEATSSTPCSPPTTCRRPSRSSSRPGRSGPRRAPRRADALLAVRRDLGGRRPRRDAGRRRGPRRRPGRGLPAGRAGPGVGPARGRDARWLDLCAGPGGKAALLAALAAGRGAPASSPTSSSPTGPSLVRRVRSPAPTACEEVTVADGTDPPWEPGLLRPGPGRRAVHRAGCAAPAARGPLAAAAGGPRVAGPAPASPAGGRARPGPPRRRGPLRHLLARCSPRPATSSGSLLVKRDDVRLRRRRALLTTAAGLRADVPDCAGPLQGTVQLWPHRHGTDAMFLALLRRA